MTRAALAGMLLLCGLLTGCLGTRSAEQPPEEQFGHRVEGDAGSRETIVITPPDSSRSYFYYPAAVDTVQVRPAAFEASVSPDSQQVAVEVLVKGSFPDACMELHRAEQERRGNIIQVDLQMRKAQGAVCASVRRPYRFYLMLEGTYDIGNYTLKLNDQVYPFEVRAPVEQS